MLLRILEVIHVLAAVVWVGGMFFAYLCLRPAAGAVLDARTRLALWDRTLGRFFIWVWAAVVLLPITGFWMLFAYGGPAAFGAGVHLMAVLGLVMVVLFLVLFFFPYRRLHGALAADDVGAASRQLSRIRWIVAVNLLLGLVVVVAAVMGG